MWQKYFLIILFSMELLKFENTGFADSLCLPKLTKLCVLVNEFCKTLQILLDMQSGKLQQIKFHECITTQECKTTVILG
jgi:hypothetical protein